MVPIGFRLQQAMKTLVSLACLAFAIVTPGPAIAAPRLDDPYVGGLICGKVLDAGDKPMSGATVVLLGPNGKVLTWTRTDDAGRYTLAADPKLALDIRPSPNRGLLMRCCNAAAEMAMAPVKVVANMIANPGLTVAAAGVSIASGTAAPIEAQAVRAQLPNHATAVQTQLSAQRAAAAQLFGVGPNPGGPDLCTEGRASLLIEGGGCGCAAASPNAYWIEPSVDRDGIRIGLRTWVDTIQLSSAKGAGVAKVVPEAFSLSDAKVTPSLAPAGSDVRISVRVSGPLDSDHPIRVFARWGPRNQVIELKPGKDGALFEGTMKLDRQASPGAATVCIAALRAEPVEVKLDSKDPAALFRFVCRLDDMNAGSKYGYDPMIMASENRADVHMLVLSPSAESPATSRSGISRASSH